MTLAVPTAYAKCGRAGYTYFAHFATLSVPGLDVRDVEVAHPVLGSTESVNTISIQWKGQGSGGKAPAPLVMIPGYAGTPAFVSSYADRDTVVLTCTRPCVNGSWRRNVLPQL